MANTYIARKVTRQKIYSVIDSDFVNEEKIILQNPKPNRHTMYVDYTYDDGSKQPLHIITEFTKLNMVENYYHPTRPSVYFLIDRNDENNIFFSNMTVRIYNKISRDLMIRYPNAKVYSSVDKDKLKVIYDNKPNSRITIHHSKKSGKGDINYNPNDSTLTTDNQNNISKPYLFLKRELPILTKVNKNKEFFLTAKMVLSVAVTQLPNYGPDKSIPVYYVGFKTNNIEIKYNVTYAKSDINSNIMRCVYDNDITSIEL